MRCGYVKRQHWSLSVMVWTDRSRQAYGYGFVSRLGDRFGRSAAVAATGGHLVTRHPGGSSAFFFGIGKIVERIAFVARVGYKYCPPFLCDEGVGIALGDEVGCRGRFGRSRVIVGL